MNIAELSDVDHDALTISTRGDLTWVTCTSNGDEVTVGPFPTHQITGALPRPDDMDGGITAALIEREAASTINPILLQTALDAALADGQALTRERDDARAMAALWKETARPAILRGREQAAAVNTLAKNLRVIRAQRNDAGMRAQKAERERDEARIALHVARRDLEQRQRSHTLRAKEQQTEIDVLRAEQPRPLTAESVTDAMVDRARFKGRELVGVVWSAGVVRPMLEAALNPPPARPGWEQESAKALTVAVWGMEIPNEAGEAGDKLAASLARHGYQVVPVTGAES